MNKKMRIVHFFSCMGLNGTRLFYRKMALRGWILKQCEYFYDSYYKEEPQDRWFGVIPVIGYVPHHKKIAEDGWNFIGKNHNFYVYYSDTSKEFDLSLYASSNYEKLFIPLAIAIMPICLFYFGQDISDNLLPLYWSSAMMIYMGMIWQYAIIKYENMQNGSFQMSKTQMFYCFAFGLLCNFAQCILICLLFTLLF